MKNLNDYKEIIHNCSKCGLCQSVCPIYQETGNECAVSRGQFIMLRGVIKGDLKINKNINKYLDLCLKCNKCSGFCPSDINIVDVILAAKAEYFKNSFEGKILSFLQSKLVFNNLMNCTKLFFKLINPQTWFEKKQSTKSCTKKAIYFGGCANKLEPDVEINAKKILNKMGIEVIEKNFDCCGLPFLTSGNFERFSAQARTNVKKILSDDFDYFITDCASCQWAWKEYAKYIDDAKLKEKLEKIEFKNIYELISESNLEFEYKKPYKVTFHKPCHEENIEYLEKILSKCKNIEYTQMDGMEDCCGFSGLTKPKNFSTVSKICKSKSENIKKTKSDYVLTSCFGCVLSLNLITLFTPKTKPTRLIKFLGKSKN